MNQKHDKKEDKMKDKNEENESKSEFYSLSFFVYIYFVFTLHFLCLHSLCVFFVHIHFVFSLFTFILYVFFYIHFVCFFFISVLTSFSFWFLTWASENVSSVASILIRLSSHRWVIYHCDKYWSWYDYNKHSSEKDIISNCKASMKWTS